MGREAGSSVGRSEGWRAADVDLPRRNGRNMMRRGHAAGSYLGDLVRCLVIMAIVAGLAVVLSEGVQYLVAWFTKLAGDG